AHLEGTVASRDLSTGMAIGGLKGGGAVSGHAKLDKQGEAFIADLDATLSRVSLGIAQLDALLGSETKIKLTAKRDAEGAVSVQPATVESPLAHLAASGTMNAAQELDLKTELALKDVSPLLPGTKGNVAATAHVLGPLDNPHADVALSDATLQLDRYTL